MIRNVRSYDSSVLVIPILGHIKKGWMNCLSVVERSSEFDWTGVMNALNSSQSLCSFLSIICDYGEEHNLKFLRSVLGEFTTSD